jgi:hypothetical protein
MIYRTESGVISGGHSNSTTTVRTPGSTGQYTGNDAACFQNFRASPTKTRCDRSGGKGKQPQLISERDDTLLKM